LISPHTASKASAITISCLLRKSTIFLFPSARLWQAPKNEAREAPAYAVPQESASAGSGTSVPPGRRPIDSSRGYARIVLPLPSGSGLDICILEDCHLQSHQTLACDEESHRVDGPGLAGSDFVFHPRRGIRQGEFRGSMKKTWKPRERLIRRASLVRTEYLAQPMPPSSGPLGKPAVGVA
jgi:hypothetical protein